MEGGLILLLGYFLPRTAEPFIASSFAGLLPGGLAGGLLGRPSQQRGDGEAGRFRGWRDVDKLMLAFPPAAAAAAAISDRLDTPNPRRKLLIQVYGDSTPLSLPPNSRQPRLRESTLHIAAPRRAAPYIVLRAIN